MKGQQRKSNDHVVVLVKALPHRSSRYFETVCCAGVGLDRKWRRQYPVPYRILQDDQRFARWSWIKYSYVPPSDDRRKESQKAIPESIRVVGKLKPNERARFVAPLFRESTEEAASRGESLTLIRPADVNLSWSRKSSTTIAQERIRHAALANQLSMFDNNDVKPVEPCPFEFSFKWQSPDGKTHTHTCDDWETSAAFFRRRKAYGEAAALQSLKQTYENEYTSRGIAFALGTHSKRSDQWLLVGVLRVDEMAQQELF